MSGITSPRAGAVGPATHKLAPHRPARGLVRNLLELLALAAFWAWPAGFVARAAYELGLLGWHAWPW